MDRIVVLWTTEEKEVAMKVVMPFLFYGRANGWWKDMHLIIWGPSVRLAAQDADVAEQLQDVLDSGVSTRVCKLCTDKYGVAEFYAQLGIEPGYVGSSLSDLIRQGEKVITF